MGHDPAAVTVNQPSQKLLSGSAHNPALPSREFDSSMMFPTHTVLGEQAKPVLGIHRNLSATARSAPESIRVLAREDRLHRRCAFLHDPRISGVGKYSQTPYAGSVSSG
jgi:hypothetical protein